MTQKKITMEMVHVAIRHYAKIIDAREEVKLHDHYVELAERERDRAQEKLHQLLWDDLIAKGKIPEEREMDGGADRRVYTDRETECTGGSPIGTCVEIGWNDSCAYCGSLRYSTPHGRRWEKK